MIDGDDEVINGDFEDDDGDDEVMSGDFEDDDPMKTPQFLSMILSFPKERMRNLATETSAKLTRRGQCRFSKLQERI